MTIRVYPGVKQPTHHISLSDGVRTYGLRLADGPQSIQEIPMTPSTVHFGGGGTKFGDWEPGMSHIEQRTWEGGRAQADFVDDATRYFDAKNAWTLTPGKLFPTPAWKFGRGYFSECAENLPRDMAWRSLYGMYDVIAEEFSHSSGWATYDKAYAWVRRVGSPSQLNIEIAPDNSGVPSPSEHTSASVSIDDVQENEVYLVEFDISGGAALSGTSSWIVFYGNEAHDAANHWEIGIDADGGNGYYYTGSPFDSWSAGAFSIYYRVTSAPANRKWHFFEFDGALYAVDNKADASASSILINGDKGKVSGSTPTTLADSNKSWTADEWAGAWVKIIYGSGEGQKRQIISNTATTLTVAAWDTTLTASSRYVIYHTDNWTDISPSSGDTFTAAVRSVCVVDNYACMAQEPTAPIMKMRYNFTSGAHEFDFDGANFASFLITMFDDTNGTQIYRAYHNSCTLGRAAPTAWGTDMTFGTHFEIGDSEGTITNLYLHDGKLYAFKPDGRYYIAPEDTAKRELGEIGFIRSGNNGQAVLSHGLYTYFSWGGYALQRLYDASGTYDLSNIGPDKDEGLPNDRRGPIVALAGSPPGILAAVDGGEDNYSSILVMPVNTYGWHEVLRGSAAGKRIQNIFFQDSYQPRLWCDMGGELVYMDWPRHSFNPLKDSGISYMPEAHLISSTIDMGVSNLPKFIESLTATVENLASGIEVQLDYQINEDVGTDSWIWAGTFQVNPFDTLEINQGEVYRIRFRLRLYTNDEGTPPIVNATVLEGYARTPVKYQWNMRLKISSTQRDMSGVSRDADPDEFLTWMKDCAKSSKRIYMRSIWEQMDSTYVIVEPPTLLRTFTNKVLGFWGGQVQVTVREK